MLDLLGRAGCVSIEAGVESITEEGRELLDKNCKLTTDEFTERLIHAKRHVPFVQANLLDAKVDDAEDDRGLARAPARARRVGERAGAAVPVSRLARLLASAGALPDDEAWERAHEYYLSEYAEFSDIQETPSAAAPAARVEPEHGD